MLSWGAGKKATHTHLCIPHITHQDVLHVMETEYVHRLNKFLKWGFPSGSLVKNPPVMQELQETWVRSLGQEDSLEEGMATHSSTLTWKIPWTEPPEGYSSWVCKESDMTKATEHAHIPKMFYQTESQGRKVYSISSLFPVTSTHSISIIK